MSRRLVLGALLLLAASCASRPPDESNYVARVAADRATKDAAFGDSATPIPFDAHARFLPLGYFPVDPAFAVPASFVEDPPAARMRIEMQTSAHQPRLMERVGTLAFTLEGQALHLSAFREVGEATDRLFVPFTDLTSGTETYPAGRYLELSRNATGIYTIDFNRAFHPYCYYNDSYDCPYPPPSNRLPIPVRAGEKLAQSNIPSAGR